jgi:hypothetical protein
MKVKITEQQLRQIIKESMIQEARMSKRRLGGERLKVPKCDFSQTLRTFTRKNGERAFSESTIQAINNSFAFGMTPAGCAAVEAGLVVLFSVIGYIRGDSKADLQDLNINRLTSLAEKDVDIINDDFSEVTHLYFPNAIESVSKSESATSIERSLKKDQKKIVKDLEKLSDSLSSSQDIERLTEFLTFTHNLSKLFRFENLKEFQEIQGKLNTEARTALKNLSSDVASAAVKSAYRNIVDQNPMEILSDRINSSYRDLKNYAEKNNDFNSAFDQNEIQRFFIDFK